MLASPGSVQDRATLPSPGAAESPLGAAGTELSANVTVTVTSSVTSAVQVVPFPEQSPPLQELTA